MHVVRRVQVKGVRAGTLPGYKRSYRCQTCQRTVQTLEVDPALLTGLEEQFEARRLKWNAERAELKQKIYYLKMPVNSKEKRIKKIRAKLIDILDDTF